MKKYFIALSGFLSLCACTASWGQSNRVSFNGEWRFLRCEDEVLHGDAFAATGYDHSGWEMVALPHTAKIEPLLVNDQWQGICWYRKIFDIDSYGPSLKYFIEFEAAMNKVSIWVNGEAVKTDQGGYLPVVADLTPFLKARGNVIALCLDNRDNPLTGPKPLKILDFCMYGGLYRNAWLITKNDLYISHPNLADKTAGGGVFITTPRVDSALSEVAVKVHVVNESSQTKRVSVKCTAFYGGKPVGEAVSDEEELSPGEDFHLRANLNIRGAHLWSVSSPDMYTMHTQLLCGDEPSDCETTRFGIREFAIRDNQLYINGERTFLRGVNRHQEYPYIGYALPDNAQRRDAVKIKQAGFDYVRLSHYPQSPSFMRACDELGIVVVNAIPGWQYYNDSDSFREHCYRSARQLIRRDRNHPCVLAWEVSLNETQMPEFFMDELHRITHSEYPGAGVYSCGWISEVYDIYMQARQHRILHPERMTFDKPYIVSEYGDWEYYSNNAGLNQHRHSREKRKELSSRQLRTDGEERLLCQARNMQQAHNDNLSIPAFADSYWVMYDYNRGYHDDVEASGVMDIFRLPKFGYHFFRSQRNTDWGYVLKIASYHNERSGDSITVYSNCDSVSLSLGGRHVETRRPDNDPDSRNLSHPPFTFDLKGLARAGELKALGFVQGREVATDIVRKPEKPVRLHCRLDDSGIPLLANDAAFVYISAVDHNGTLCTDYDGIIEVRVSSPGITVLNPEPLKAQAGIATLLIKTGTRKAAANISAVSEDNLKGRLKITIY